MSGAASSPFPAKFRRILLALLILAVVTIADYWSGFELSFAIFYLISVFLAAWFVGWRTSLVISVISVVCSLMGDLASGARYSSALVPWWNMGILFCFYMAMVLVVTKLRASRQELELRVQERTAELSGQIRERERLEKALLDASEREQRRIGHDLHDSLCQHLTGTALAAQVLCGKLETRSQAEAEDAEHLVAMIESGIDLSRSLARGLAPVELDANGLMTGLRELARYTSEHTAMECRLQAADPVRLDDAQVTTQLFRIAQEAVRNAVKHSRGKRIVITLTKREDGLVMRVEDDGMGLQHPSAESGGMGLHIMRYRASMIGAHFEASALKPGTCVTVSVPLV